MKYMRICPGRYECNTPSMEFMITQEGDGLWWLWLRPTGHIVWSGVNNFKSLKDAKRDLVKRIG